MLKLRVSIAWSRPPGWDLAARAPIQRFGFMNFQCFRLAGMIAGLVIAVTTVFDPAAQAGTTFLIPGITMTDGFAGALCLPCPENCTVPSLNAGIIPYLRSSNYPIPTSVDFTIYKAGRAVFKIDSVFNFLYNSGFSQAEDGNYFVDLQTVANGLSPTFLGVTVENSLAGADFADTSGLMSGLVLPHGYFTETLSPVVEISSTPEPATLLLLGTALAGLAGIGARRVRRSQRLKSTSEIVPS